MRSTKPTFVEIPKISFLQHLTLRPLYPGISLGRQLGLPEYSNSYHVGGTLEATSRDRQTRHACTRIRFEHGKHWVMFQVCRRKRRRVLNMRRLVGFREPHVRSALWISIYFMKLYRPVLEMPDAFHDEKKSIQIGTKQGVGG